MDNRYVGYTVVWDVEIDVANKTKLHLKAIYCLTDIKSLPCVLFVGKQPADGSKNHESETGTAIRLQAQDKEHQLSASNRTCV